MAITFPEWKEPPNPNTDAGSLNKVNSDSPRSIENINGNNKSIPLVYGDERVVGEVVLVHIDVTSQACPVLYVHFAFGEGPMNAITTVYVDRIDVDDPTDGLIAKGGLVNEFVNGAPVSSYLVNSSDIPNFTNGHEGYCIVELCIPTDVWPNFPRCEALIQGKKVYDPRLDSSRPNGSGTHRVNDSSTWAYTKNPVLHYLDILVNHSTLKPNWQSFMTAADFDDETVDGEARRELGLTLRTPQSVETVKELFAAYTGCHINHADGEVVMVPKTTDLEYALPLGQDLTTNSPSSGTVTQFTGSQVLSFSSVVCSGTQVSWSNAVVAAPCPVLYVATVTNYSGSGRLFIDFSSSDSQISIEDAHAIHGNGEFKGAAYIQSTGSINITTDGTFTGDLDIKFIKLEQSGPNLLHETTGIINKGALHNAVDDGDWTVAGTSFESIQGGFEGDCGDTKTNTANPGMQVPWNSQTFNVVPTGTNGGTYDVSWDDEYEEYVLEFTVPNTSNAAVSINLDSLSEENLPANEGYTIVGEYKADGGSWLSSYLRVGIGASASMTTLDYFNPDPAAEEWTPFEISGAFSRQHFGIYVITPVGFPATLKFRNLRIATNNFNRKRIEWTTSGCYASLDVNEFVKNDRPYLLKGWWSVLSGAGSVANIKHSPHSDLDGDGLTGNITLAQAQFTDTSIKEFYGVFMGRIEGENFVGFRQSATSGGVLLGSVSLYELNPAGVAMFFDDDNIQQDSMQLIARSEREYPNNVEVTFTDNSDTRRPRDSVEATIDGVAEGLIGERIERVAMPGIHRRSQAYREAVLRVSSAQYNLQGAFIGFDQGAQLLVGSLIQVNPLLQKFRDLVYQDRLNEAGSWVEFLNGSTGGTTSFGNSTLTVTQGSNSVYMGRTLSLYVEPNTDYIMATNFVCPDTGGSNTRIGVGVSVSETPSIAYETRTEAQFGGSVFELEFNSGANSQLVFHLLDGGAATKETRFEYFALYKKGNNNLHGYDKAYRVLQLIQDFGRWQVDFIEYNEAAYIDESIADIAFESFSVGDLFGQGVQGLIGDGQLIGVKKNFTDFTTATNFHAYVHGFNCSTAVDAAGKIFVEDGSVTLGTGAAAQQIITSQLNQTGFVIYETGFGVPFVMDGTTADKKIAFAWIVSGDWVYDDGATTQTFLTTSTMRVVGQLVTGASAIDSVVVTPYSTSLDEADTLQFIDTETLDNDRVPVDGNIVTNTNFEGIASNFWDFGL